MTVRAIFLVAARGLSPFRVGLGPTQKTPAKTRRTVQARPTLASLGTNRAKWSCAPRAPGRVLGRRLWTVGSRADRQLPRELPDELQCQKTARFRISLVKRLPRPGQRAPAD